MRVYHESLTPAQIVDINGSTKRHLLATEHVGYSYDVYDRRIGKTYGPTVGPPQVEYFVYGAGTEEYSEIQFRFKNGNLTNRFLHGPAVDQILADEQYDPSDPNHNDPATQLGNVFFPLNDNLGTTRDIATYDSGTSTTTVANHIEYDSYGRITSETSPTLEYLYGWTGRERDRETDDLYFHNARYYSVTTATWISEDPSGFSAGDANLYRYTGNDPINNVDPSGLKKFAQKGKAWKGYVRGVEEKILNDKSIALYKARNKERLVDLGYDPSIYELKIMPFARTRYGDPIYQVVKILTLEEKAARERSFQSLHALLSKGWEKARAEDKRRASKARMDNTWTARYLEEGRKDFKRNAGNFINPLSKGNVIATFSVSLFGGIIELAPTSMMELSSAAEADFLENARRSDTLVGKAAWNAMRVVNYGNSVYTQGIYVVGTGNALAPVASSKLVAPIIASKPVQAITLTTGAAVATNNIASDISNGNVPQPHNLVLGAFTAYGIKYVVTNNGLVRVNNPVPKTFARVMPEGTPLRTLGSPTAADTFVTDAAAIRRMSAAELAKALEINPASGYHIIEFGSAGVKGIGTPVFRNNPLFIGRGVTSGGLPEYVVPNGPIPKGATIRTVR